MKTLKCIFLTLGIVFFASCIGVLLVKQIETPEYKIEQEPRVNIDGNEVFATWVWHDGKIIHSEFDPIEGITEAKIQQRRQEAEKLIETLKTAEE